MKKVLVVAGESSGDLHGGKLVQALLEQEKHLKVYAVGGPAIEAAGGELIFNIDSLGVVGLFEVFRHLKAIRRAFQSIRQLLALESIDQLILIDYPDFNLRVARRAKKLGIPVTYYISPQIWAWRYNRIHLIKTLVNQMLVILPFEEKIYQKEKIPVEFVGHPLLEEIAPSYNKDLLCNKYGLDPENPIIGICPGSRESELNRLLPVMLEAALKLKKENPKMQFVLPVASAFATEAVQARLGRLSGEMIAVKGNTNELMAMCDILMIASGTATLQAAIIGIPMVVVYKVSFLTYWIGKMMLKIRNISLVNILMNDNIVPELIQKEVTPEKIKGKVMDFLENRDKIEKLKKNLSLIREKLSGKRASYRAAEAILRMLRT